MAPEMKILLLIPVPDFQHAIFPVGMFPIRTTKPENPSRFEYSCTPPDREDNLDKTDDPRPAATCMSRLGINTPQTACRQKGTGVWPSG